MKRNYVSPQLSTLGRVHDITGILGSPGGGDFVWDISDPNNPEVISNENDLDSIDLCTTTGGAPFDYCPDDFQRP